jgi:RNA polymerase sigma-70 factor, ECF subfamily
MKSDRSATMHAWTANPHLEPPAGFRQLTNPFAVRRSVHGARPESAVAVAGAMAGSRVGLAAARSVADEPVAPTDAELMARVAAGDQGAFASVYDRHAPAVYGAVMRYLRDPGAAEDVVQETYLAAWSSAGVYAPESGSLVGWLLSIARHRAIDRLRASARRPQLVDPSAGDPGDGDDGLERLLSIGRPTSGVATSAEPSDVAERSWVSSVVRTAIAEMPADERQALELAYDYGLSQSEIAEKLGWPIGTVKTRTRRALLRLRAMLESVPDLAPISAFRQADVATTLEGGQHGPR